MNILLTFIAVGITNSNAVATISGNQVAADADILNSLQISPNNPVPPLFVVTGSTSADPAPPSDCALSCDQKPKNPTQPVTNYKIGSITGGVGSTTGGVDNIQPLGSVSSPSIQGSTTCNCSQINSSIYSLQLQTSNLNTAVYTNLQNVINGLIAQITQLNSQTANLNTRVTTQDALIQNQQAQINTLSATGGGSNCGCTGCSSGGGSSLVQTLATLQYIQNQGYLQVSNRWRIGEISSFSPSFVIQDTLTTSPIINVYEFLNGRGIRTYP